VTWSAVLVIPAIDIRGGNCVRLVQGDYSQETVFGTEPARIARRWLVSGARALHVVDLDGAKSGTAANAAAVRGILAEARALRGSQSEPPVTVQLGGGIRDAEAAGRWLDEGIDRVILGTIAVNAPSVVSEICRRFPGRAWVGIDARGGKVAVSGWTAPTTRDAVELAREAEARGAAGVVFTDIDRDGTGRGVDVAAVAEIARALRVPVIASGGVRTVEDVRSLRELGAGVVSGVIVGRALYDGAVTLEALLAAAS
jgi:phosphoribosylformimino-5-aminoimidazole carboxamide ribotide isomerase